jgi:nucleoid-associated protein EbfC
MKMLGALTSLMKNKDKLREAGERVRATMAQLRVQGDAGAGAVRAVASGQMRIISIELTPALANGMAADDRTRALAGDLIAQAVNAALAAAQAQLAKTIDKEARDLGLEGVLPEARTLMGGP